MSPTTPKIPNVREPSRWRSLVSVLCMVVIVVPSASCLPFSLILQFRLMSEEEVHTVGVTWVGTADVRRKTARLPKHRILPAAYPASARLASSQFPAGDRSENRLLNGIGAPLRR